MSKKSRISESHSIADMLKLIEAAGSMESLYRSIPLLQRVFPGCNGTADKLAELKVQVRIT